MSIHYLPAILLFLVLLSPARAQPIDLRNDPRAEAEYLALEITESLIADQELAGQIEQDLAQIRIENPELADIHVSPDWMPGEVLVDLTDDAFEEVKAGTFTGFDELFDQLGTPLVRLRGDHPALTPGVDLQFGEVYHSLLLAELFAEVPGVIDTWANWTIGGGDDIVATADRRYVFSRGDGDCPAGCIGRNEWEFSFAQGTILDANIPEPTQTYNVLCLLAICTILITNATRHRKVTDLRPFTSNR